MTDPIAHLDADEEAPTDTTVKAKRKARIEADDLKWLMAHKQGRRIAYKLLSDAGLFRNPFNHSGSVTAFNCGAMNIGQQFLAQIMEHAPDSYMTMCKEQRNDE